MSWIKKASDLDWSEDEKGLTITITPALLENLKEREATGENMDSDEIMYQVLEPLIDYGYEWIRPEEIGALTSAPIIGNVDRDDNGNIIKLRSLFWYPDYAITSPIGDLMEKWTVTFKRESTELEKKSVPEENVVAGQEEKQ